MNVRNVAPGVKGSIIAGATVIQPRERDTQTAMVIIDSTAMREQDGKTVAETIVPAEGERICLRKKDDGLYLYKGLIILVR